MWSEEQGYVGTTESGKKFEIYGSDSPSPMEMVLHGHAACSLIDIIGGLKDRVESVEAIKIEIKAERAPEAPRVFTSVSYTHLTLPTKA